MSLYQNVNEKIENIDDSFDDVLQAVNNSEFIGKITMSEKEKVFLNRLDTIIKNQNTENYFLNQLRNKKGGV